MSSASATVVVGSGPAGLLFTLCAGIRQRQSSSPDVPFLLVDKRASYDRTHRLRIDPVPYQAAQESLNDPLFDELMDWLEGEKFQPAANQLEAMLQGLVAQLGIRKQRLTVGTGHDEHDIGSLRKWLTDERALEPGDTMLVIGADSVRSATRQLVADAADGVEHVHQTVARLRIEAPDLPEQLTPVQQLKISKLLGSAIDYRRNQNGWGEVDLFLSPAEHASVEALGPRPADPVPLDDDALAQLNAPLFQSVVRHLTTSLGSAPGHAWATSTFRLEHRYQETVAYPVPEHNALVLLVGDAAVSLPFFRGMACLMACVDALSEAHQRFIDIPTDADRTATLEASYNTAAGSIRSREVKAVLRRARAVAWARELVRISSLAPFPIQYWLLSLRPKPPTVARKASATWIVLISLLVLAAGFAIASPWIGVAGLLSIPLQLGAGAVYRSTLGQPPIVRPRLAMACRIQVFTLMLAGLLVAATGPAEAHVWTRAGALIGWWVLGLVFIAGIYATELHATWRTRSASAGTPTSVRYPSVRRDPG